MFTETWGSGDSPSQVPIFMFVHLEYIFPPKGLMIGQLFTEQSGMLFWTVSHPTQPQRVEFLTFRQLWCHFWSNDTWPETWVHFSNYTTTLGRKPLVGIFSPEGDKGKQALEGSWKTLGFSACSPLTGGMWYIHTSEYYSAFEKKEIIPCVTTWVDLEDIIPSAIAITERHVLHDSTSMTFLEQSNS